MRRKEPHPTAGGRGLHLCSLSACCSMLVGVALAGALGAAHAEAIGDDHHLVVDTHAHLRIGDDDALLPDQPKGTDALRKLDVEAGVGLSALIVIAQRGKPERTRRMNDAVLAAAEADPEHFYAVVSVHPADGKAAIRELERVSRRGAREVKLHPNAQDFDAADPRLDPIMDACGRLGLVVLFDAFKPWDSSELGKLMLLSLRHPQTRFILAHLGFSEFRDTISFAMLQRLGRKANVWFDLSAVAPLYADSPVQPELVWTIRKLGIPQILFGSDYPVYAPAEALAAFRRLGFTDKEQAQILRDNALRLLGRAADPAAAGLGSP